MLRTLRPGMSPFGILFFIILLLILFFMADMAYIFGSQKCIDDSFLDCALDIVTSDDEEEAPAEAVTATGVYSHTDKKGTERSVTVSLSFPLDGGAVSGSFSGDCDGTIKGTYAGGNGGAISGKAKGSCAFILPASATFSGTVNQTGKSVFISGQGGAAGFSGEGSLTLTY